MLPYVLLLLLAVLPQFSSVSAQRLQVSDNGRFLVTEDGKPFFWLADTAWELIHRCKREEVDFYLEKRKSQGFNVIQTVALAELDGLNTPNPYGETPLIDNNPATPNPAYFEHVDYVLDRAAELGLYVALLPTWGDKLFTNSWGLGPEVLNEENAHAYGRWIGRRYRDRENIIWVNGGDRNPREGSQDVAVWRALAQGLSEGLGGKGKGLMTFHPQPDGRGGSSRWFHGDEWLDFNMHQTGHCANQPTYELIAADYARRPVKPVLDGEPLYEDHPNCFNARELGYSSARDIRRIMYWNVFAGAFGQSYGCHDVWQMYDLGREGINGPLRPWKEAMDLPMAGQVRHLKNLFLSRPFLTRIPDPGIILDTFADYRDQVLATRDEDGAYAMVYFPTGLPTRLDLGSLNGSTYQAWWYDPSTGAAFAAELPTVSGPLTVTPPSRGVGNDWVLVVDSAEAGFAAPGR